MTTGIEIKTNDELIKDIVELDSAIEDLREARGRIAVELQKRMEADGATEVPHDTFLVQLKTTNAYDPQRLLGLFEFIDKDELIAAGVYTLEHQETVTVPEQWNAVKLKRFLGRGKDVRELVKRAKIPTTRLLIKPKDPKE